VTVFNPAQSLNASAGIVLTVVPIVNSDNFVQPSKSPLEAQFSALNVTSVRPVQLLNA
jgi:hypothetical protein